MFPSRFRNRSILSFSFLIVGIALLTKAIRVPAHAAVYYVECDGQRSLSPQALLATLHATIQDRLDGAGPPKPVLILHGADVDAKFEVGLTNMNSSAVFVSNQLGDFKRAVLVRSTNEARDPIGMTAEPIAKGCGLPLLPPIKKNEISALQACKGPYSRENIAAVADVVVVPWTQESECDARCVQDNVQITLAPLIRLVGGLGRSGYDSVIIPAVGSGAGGMSPALFYASFANEYDESLANSTTGTWRIVFPVYQRDWQEPGKRTAIGDPLAEALRTIASKWQRTMAGNEVEQNEHLDRFRRLVLLSSGICFGMALLLLVRVPRWANSAPQLNFAWLAASVAGCLTFSFPVAYAIVDWLVESTNMRLSQPIVLLIGGFTVPLVLLIKNFQSLAQTHIEQLSP